jgi:hypothetical protein
VKNKPQGAHHKQLKLKPGETSAYLLRRIERERPELAAGRHLVRAQGFRLYRLAFARMRGLQPAYNRQKTVTLSHRFGCH